MEVSHHIHESGSCSPGVTVYGPAGKIPKLSGPLGVIPRRGTACSANAPHDPKSTHLLIKAHTPLTLEAWPPKLDLNSSQRYSHLTNVASEKAC